MLGKLIPSFSVKIFFAIAGPAKLEERLGNPLYRNRSHPKSLISNALNKAKGWEKTSFAMLGATRRLGELSSSLVSSYFLLLILYLLLPYNKRFSFRSDP